ncbi:hypothetical protein F0562_010165 [Nyssa sinensis]|uniref:Uncharacterized protein n=1 Tax=Nyssa sinensis TaxID=561372 RepID=A0A5J5A1T4_9ASTE|nr:hypothetical protein F0562_010165 [Nyssa sinensis]
MLLLEEEKRIMAVVKSTADYFHGNAGKDEGLRLFVIVRDFLIMLDKIPNNLLILVSGFFRQSETGGWIILVQMMTLHRFCLVQVGQFVEVHRD